MSFRSSAYRAVAHKLSELRNLRKVKLFPTVGSVTIITYYKHEGAEADYIGSAHLLSFKSLRLMNIELAHTSHLPPPHGTDEEEDLELEIEGDPAPVATPAIGATILSPWQSNSLRDYERI